MNKQELELYLDTLIAAASIIRDKALKDNNSVQIGYFFCRGINNAPCIQFYHSIRWMAEMLGLDVLQKEHNEDHYEIGIIYKDWYLFELEDKDE